MTMRGLIEAGPRTIGIDFGASEELAVAVVKVDRNGVMEIVGVKHGDEARAILRALEGGGE